MPLQGNKMWIILFDISSVRGHVQITQTISWITQSQSEASHDYYPMLRARKENYNGLYFLNLDIAVLINTSRCTRNIWPCHICKLKTLFSSVSSMIWFCSSLYRFRSHLESIRDHVLKQINALRQQKWVSLLQKAWCSSAHIVHIKNMASFGNIKSLRDSEVEITPF